MNAQRYGAAILDVCDGTVAELFAEFEVTMFRHFPPPSTHRWDWTLSNGLVVVLRLERDGPRWFLEPPEHEAMTP